METQPASSEPRPTREVNERERKLIRQSELGYAELARIFFITEDQVRYIRSAEGKQAKRAPQVWSAEEEAQLKDMYEKLGWKPRLIAHAIKGKTYNQVYRKMRREFKGR